MGLGLLVYEKDFCHNLDQFITDDYIYKSY